jgi:hypothetical protein
MSQGGTSRAGRGAPLWLLTLVGILITVIGILLQISDKSALGQIVAGSCTAVGGGVLGATLSIYVSAMGNKDALAEMRTIISNSMSARLLSPDAELDAVRRKWHYYHQTQREGAFVWRYTEYDFSRTTSVGSLSIDIVDSMNGRDERFRVEAAVRGTMLFVTDTWLDGAGPPGIAVVPGFTEGYKTVRAGFMEVRTWDNTNILARCLISTMPLVPTGNGDDIAAVDGERLDATWEREFASTRRVFPAVTDTP